MDLDAIEACCARATPGPWHHYSEEGPYRLPSGERTTSQTASVCHYDGDIDRAHVCVAHTVGHNEEHAAHDAEFIAAARSDVPAMAAEIRALRRDLATVRGAAKNLEAAHGARSAHESRVLRAAALDGRDALVAAWEGAVEEARQWNATATALAERVAALEGESDPIQHYQAAIDKFTTTLREFDAAYRTAVADAEIDIGEGLKHDLHLGS